MLKFEKECVGCPPEKGCLGDRCPNRNVARCYCDECENEFDPIELYDFDGDMMCQDCLLGHFQTVAQVGIERWCD